jgi:hypothetical protein
MAKTRKPRPRVFWSSATNPKYTGSVFELASLFAAVEDLWVDVSADRLADEEFRCLICCSNRSKADWAHAVLANKIITKAGNNEK